MPRDRASWSCLPTEIFNKIFGYLPRLDMRYSLLATVCRNWQMMIEPHTFAEISLTIARLADTNSQSILFRKRRYIRYILFRVDLKQYHAGGCANEEPDTWHLCPTGNRTIVNTFKNLFTALGRWEPRGDLVLDVDVCPPTWDQLYIKCSCPWPQHCIAHQYTAEKSLHHIIDIGLFLDEESEMWWWRGLPLVPVVGVVHLSHHTHHQWNPAALASMFTRFPNMKELCYEPWRDITDSDSYIGKRKCLFYPRKLSRHRR